MSAFELAGSRRRDLAAKEAGDSAIGARGVVALLRAILRAMRLGQNSWVAGRRLESLSDWQLKDIGLHRTHVRYLAGSLTGSARSTHAAD